MKRILFLFLLFSQMMAYAQPLFINDSVIPILSELKNEISSEKDHELLTITSFNPNNLTISNCQYADQDYFLLDISYATVPKVNQYTWSNRNVDNRSCFKIDEYTTPCFEYSSVDSSFQLTARVYKKKYSNPNDEISAGLRPAIIFMRGGGYLPGSGGLRSNNPSNISADDVFCRNLAELGFVVFNIDYRKGWDAQRYYPYKKILPAINTQLAPNSCECEIADSCKSFTFLQATYRMAQDVRAAHRKILEIGSQFNIDRDYVFYSGGSTGAIGVMSAAFGFNDLPSVKEFPSNPMSRDLLSSCGGIDVIGVGLTSGYTMNVSGVYALQAAFPYDVDFIDNNDPVEILGIAHGTEDTPVSYCENTLIAGLFGAGPNGSRDHLDDNHINLFGTGQIYNRYKTLDNKYSVTLELPGVEHELNLHGLAGKRMKCYVENPFLPACNIFKTSFSNAEIVQGAGAVFKALVEPIVIGSMYDYYVNNLNHSKYFKVNNVLNCSTCKYKELLDPDVCGL